MRRIISVLIAALLINLSVQQDDYGWCLINCQSEYNGCVSVKETANCMHTKYSCNASCLSMCPHDLWCHINVHNEYNGCVPVLGAPLCWEYRDQGTKMCNEKCKQWNRRWLINLHQTWINNYFMSENDF